MLQFKSVRFQTIVYESFPVQVNIQLSYGETWSFTLLLKSAKLFLPIAEKKDFVSGIQARDFILKSKHLLESESAVIAWESRF